MRYQQLLCLSALAFSSVQLVANDIEPGKEYYTAIRAPKPIVLDGDLSEWSGAAVLADPRFAVPKGSGGATGNLVFFELYDAGGPGTAVWTGPDDQTSAVQVVYDDNNVYFGFVVTDEYHENSANSAWNGDSVQLMIADAARTNQVALYNYALGGIETELGEVVLMHEAGPAVDEACNCATEVVVKRNTTTKRTTYEIKLPKASLGLETLTGGVKFGLGMAINDGDEDAPGQQGWGGLGAHALVFGKSPSETALVTLAKSNDIEPGKEYYTANPAPKAIVLDGNLTEWSGVPVLSDPRFSVPKGSARTGTPVLYEVYDAGGPGTADWTGPDDHTSAVQIVYDADNIYFGFVVTDEYHENSANSAWNGDSIQLMIADGAQTNQVALYNYALGGIETELGEVVLMHEAGPAVDEACNCPTEVVVNRNTTTKRTTYEIKLPKAALGIETLALGTQFGLGMAINDGDEAAPGQQGWGGLGAHALVFGKSPGETALVTLGVGGTGADLIYLSAINSTLNGFSFRVTDKGASILDPATVKLFIDDVSVPVTVSPKNLDATDVSYTRPTYFAPDSDHTYIIEVKDTAGNTVTSTSTFKTIHYAILTQSMQAVSVDKSKPGFLVKVFQNETPIGETETTAAALPNSLASAELALKGELKDDGGTLLDNWVDVTVTGPALAAGVKDGPLYRYEIPTVINLNELGDGFAGAGNFVPDEQMPGIPGITGSSDGFDAQIITFVELPAGMITMGVVSDDSFRAQVGYLNVLADALLLSEVSGTTANVSFPILVQDAGVYPVRVIWQEAGGGANLELFTRKADGTLVLLNDTANGGVPCYRTGVAPNKPAGAPTLGLTRTGTTAVITYTGTLQAADQVTGQFNDVTGATSPYTVPTTGTARYFRARN